MTSPQLDTFDEPVSVDAAAEPDAVAGRSPTRLAYERFRKDKLSMASFFVVVFYALAAISAPILAKLGVIDPLSIHQDLLNEFTLPAGKWGGISWEHPLGVEPGLGRDVLSRIWLGLTLSLTISIAGSIMATVIGVVMGIVAGFSGGWVDAIIGRLIDLTLSFPQILLILALSSVGLATVSKVFHTGDESADRTAAVYVILLLGLFAWTGIARLVRGQVLSLREREFVEAARVVGAGPMRMYFKEILPNLWAPIIVTFTLYLPAFVSAEAALAFLGVSIHPPTPTLGNVLNDSLIYASADPVYFFAPAIAIALIVVCFNLLGDGIRDALDPKGSR